MRSALTSALLVLSAWIGAPAQLAKGPEKAPAPMAQGVNPIRRGDSSLEIVIQDAIGAVITKASLSIIQEETGVELHGQSNERGGYAVSDLAPGTYAVRAEARGFKITKTRLRLRDHETLKWAIVLQVDNTPSGSPNADQISVPTISSSLDSEVLPEPRPIDESRTINPPSKSNPIQRFFSAIGHKLGF